MRSAREFLLAIAIVVFVWASLTSRRLPTQVQSFLFFVVLILEVGLIVAGWWAWKKSRGILDGAGGEGMLASPVLSVTPWRLRFRCFPSPT